MTPVESSIHELGANYSASVSLFLENEVVTCLPLPLFGKPREIIVSERFENTKSIINAN